MHSKYRFLRLKSCWAIPYLVYLSSYSMPRSQKASCRYIFQEQICESWRT